MMRTMAVEERLRRGRMEAKSRDAMFRAKIEHGAKCAPFVSAAILQTLKEVEAGKKRWQEPKQALIAQKRFLTRFGFSRLKLFAYQAAIHFSHFLNSVLREATHAISNNAVTESP